MLGRHCFTDEGCDSSRSENVLEGSAYSLYEGSGSQIMKGTLSWWLYTGPCFSIENETIFNNFLRHIE